MTGFGARVPLPAILALGFALCVAGCAAPAPKVAAPIESRGEDPVLARPGAGVPGASPRDSVSGTDDAPLQLARAAPATPLPAAVAPARTPAVQSLFAAALQSATRGDWDRAQAALERAIRLAPADAGLWAELAYTQYRRGAFEQAGQTAERALSIARSQQLDVVPLQRLIAEIASSGGAR